jgi:hypothetical protein
VVSGKGAAEVDRGLLEDLRGDLTPPREPGNAPGDRPINGHDEDAASVLAPLPGVECVDEVEPCPRNRQRRVNPCPGDGADDELEALVVGEP